MVSYVKGFNIRALNTPQLDESDLGLIIGEKKLSLEKEAYDLIFELAGKPYNEIIEYLHLNKIDCLNNIFTRAGIWELITKEVCEVIKLAFELTNSDTIYFHAVGSGLEELALEKSNVFDELPLIRNFDLNPEQEKKYAQYSINIEKRNVNDLILEEDKDKKILNVIVFPSSKIQKDIIEGLKKNNQNYTGLLLIGEIITGCCIDDTIIEDTYQINYKWTRFYSAPSLSFNDYTYDPQLAKYRDKYTKIKYISNQMLFVNSKMIPDLSLNQESIELLSKYTKLDNYYYLIYLMLEQIHFIKEQGILYDMNLDSIEFLMINIFEFIDELPEELIILYFKNLRHIKADLSILLYIKYIVKDSFILPNLNKKIDIKKLKEEYLPKFTTRTDIIVRIDLMNFLRMNFMKDAENIYYSRCNVCFKQIKKRCSKCLTPYCSAICQKLDWKLFEHKRHCKEIAIKYNEIKEQLEKEETKELKKNERKNKIKENRINRRKNR